MTNNGRVHRLGTLTAGGSMVVFGLLFLLRLFTDAVTYRLIFSLWPLMLISLGTELLCSFRREQPVYDKGAVFLLCLLTLFAMGMACCDLLLTEGAELLRQAAEHIHV